MPEIARVVITANYNGTVSVPQGWNLLVTDNLQIDTATLQRGFNANINAVGVTMTGGRVTAAPNNAGQFMGNVLSIILQQGGSGLMTMSGGSFEANTTLFNQYFVALTGNVTFAGSTGFQITSVASNTFTSNNVSHNTAADIAHFCAR